MSSVLALFISGNQFLFENKGFTVEQINSMQHLADTRFSGSSKLKQLNETEICSLFQVEVNSSLGLKLNLVEISSVIRINK